MLSGKDYGYLLWGRREGKDVVGVILFYLGISFGKFIEELVFGSGGYF